MEKRILCFGDSNTWGAIPGESTRFTSDIRWTGVLQKELGDEYTVIEEGNSGRSSIHDDPMERRLSGLTYFVPCCESHSPLDLIIIMLGTNDLKVRFGETPRTVAMGFNRYQEVLPISFIDGEPPKVLLTSPIWINAAYKENPTFCDLYGEDAVERSKKLAPAFEEVAKANGWEFMDASLYAKASARDGIHMDAEAHISLGKAIARKVREILG